MKKIGLIAGYGKFPFVFSEAVRKKGFRIIAVGIKGEADKNLEKYVDKLYLIGIGQLGKIIEVFQKEGINEAVMAGAITKKVLFSDISMDDRVKNILSSLSDKNDDSLLVAVANELEKEGIKIKDSTSLVPMITVEKGTLTRREPTAEEWRDIRFGMKMAKKIGRLNIGQTVAVKDQVVLAVEAMEGTDRTIKRAADLGGGGIVVAKASKPNQDLRFDLPAIGVTTIRVLKSVKSKVLAIEAGKTILLEKEKVLEEANQANISIVAL